MFFSFLAYLFLALINVTLRPAMEPYLITAHEVISIIIIVYLTESKNADLKSSSGDEMDQRIIDEFDLVNMI